ncbi:MAG: DNA repair helicase XPB [Planctomycetota bacterium]
MEKPLIVQSDRSVLLEVNNPSYHDARDGISRFAELEKSPEHIHFYRLTPLSIWNAASAGMTADEMVEALRAFSRYEVPRNVERDIRDYVRRYGLVRLVRRGEEMLLTSEDAVILEEVNRNPLTQRYLLGRAGDGALMMDPAFRGHVKQAMIKIGYPVEDLAGYVEGGRFDIRLRRTCRSGKEFVLRPYQLDSVDVFHAGGAARGGSGVVVLPCGAGKTIVGMGVMGQLNTKTLILTTSLVALRQWQQELIDKTEVSPEDVGEYSGEVKNIRPITLSTYQILTYRRAKVDPFLHFGLFRDHDWGLIIYDEVHLLPAPVFRMTAEIQATRRLGLTATLIREDGREDEVFSLIGPKKLDVPWKVLEKQGWIAQATCTEVRIPIADERRMDYALADQRRKFRIGSENPRKLPVIHRLLDHHKQSQILVIGQYLDQLKKVRDALKAPLITGKTPNRDRQDLYAKFKTGELGLLLVSKVGNFAVDLPEANVLIQISGTFGSRQEEAQRLGRILRPNRNGAVSHFYSLVTRDTRDQEFAEKRQRYLTEQGYAYEIIDDTEIGTRDAYAG